MFVGMLAAIARAMWKARPGRPGEPQPGIDEEWLIHLRPPVSLELLDGLAERSGGRLTWKRDGATRQAFGVAMAFHAGPRSNDIAFTPDFLPHLFVDQIHIGMPLEELCRRYRKIAREVADPDDDITARFEAGPDGVHTYSGAMTASGHELIARVKHGRVLSFTIAVPGHRAADRAIHARFLAGRKAAARKVAEHRAWQLRFLGNLATTVAEDDAMLDHWATENEDGPTIAAFLRQGGPDDWHAVASSWNWDDGLEPLFWIVRRPDCDAATALTILSMSEADYYLSYAGRPDEIPSSNLDGFWLSSEILDRWQRGFYTRSEIAFTPDPGEFDELLDRAGNAHPAPPSMTEPRSGRKVLTRG